MPDREKVINGLKHCTRKAGYNTCEGCPYEEFECRDLKQDALTLLEDQDTGWISVKERLPEKDEDVIIYGYYVGQSGETYPTTIISDIEEFKHFECVPIAWMSLPKPPKEA